MGRKKKVIEKVQEVVPVEIQGVEEVSKQAILPVSVDYPTEGLNNMAKKINELIEHINGL